LNERTNLDRRRLSEAWFSWKIRNFFIAPLSTMNDLNYFSSKNSEEKIKTHYSEIKNYFKNYWKQFHEKNCHIDNCKSIGDE
jgi:hypothetical protein